MKNRFFRKKLVYITTLTLLLVVFTSLSFKVVAEESGGEPPGFGEWYTYGNGTCFELTNSSYYNVTLTSSENVSIFLESTPGFVIFYIEKNCMADSTIITLTGLEVNKSYYLYQDFIQEWQFTTDEFGTYCYTQDLLEPHDIVIMENVSTFYIRSDGSIYPPSAPIINIGNTYMLTEDIIETGYSGINIVIQKSNIIFDGQGHKIEYWNLYPRGYGFWIEDIINVTIKNINFIQKSRGVHARRVPHLTITNCTFSKTVYPMEIEGYWGKSNYVTITNNIISTFTSKCGLGIGIWLGSSCHYATIANNTILSNGYGNGMSLIHSWGSTITNNIINNCNRGMFFHGGSNTYITNNKISNNYVGFGFDIWYRTHKTFYHNNITGNTYQVSGVYASDHTWDNGAGEGNYWSDYDGVDDGSNGRTADDGIGDTLIPHPYTDQGNGYYQLDNFPLMKPWSANDPPVANAGGPYEGNEGVEITLDASGSSDPNDDPLTYEWDLDNDGQYDDATGITTPFIQTENGIYTIGLRVTDDKFESDTDSTTVTVNDLAPTAAFTWNPEPQDEGSPVEFTDTSNSYPDAIVDWSWDFAGLDTSSNQNPIFTFQDNNIYTVTLTVTDDDGSTNTISHDVTINNVVPTAEAGENKIGLEPSPFTFTGSHTDPGTLDTHIYEWDFDYDGITFDIEATGNNVINIWEDDFDGIVALRVTDDDGGWHIDTCTVTVDNVAPTIETLTLPLEPMQIDTPVDLTATFSDPGILDTHIATIDWDDGNITTGTISGSGGTYTVTDSWIYGQPGVYTIYITVEDDDGGCDTASFKYVVIYDPSAGFVTGGGFIMSPEGAFTPDPTLTGKANFGFVAKYKKGQSTPDGNTEFNFKVANMNFHSNEYEWLVIQITGAKAIYKGTGTINGEGNYGFKITAIDEDLTPSTDVDLFRIKIWDKDNNDLVIYDNQLGAEDDSDPTTEIGGGNIKIHEG